MSSPDELVLDVSMRERLNWLWLLYAPKPTRTRFLEPENLGHSGADPENPDPIPTFGKHTYPDGRKNFNYPLDLKDLVWKRKIYNTCMSQKTWNEFTDLEGVTR